MLSGEATNTNFIIFGLNRPGLEPTISRTRGEHTNQYATDAVYRFDNTICFSLIYIACNVVSLLKINGYVYGNLPDFPVYEGERVVFYSLGLNLGIHIIAVQGQTLMVKDRRFVTN